MKSVLILFFAFLVGCTSTPADPPVVHQSIEIWKIESVAGYEDIFVVEMDRECGDPGEGWSLVPARIQPDTDCGTFYYIIDNNKGYICGPPECATTSQMVRMYEWLADEMKYQNTVPQEG